MKFIDKLAEKMVPFAQIIANNKYLLSLRDGFMVAFPATMFASIMIIIQNLPATFGLSEKLPEGFITFLNDFFGPIGNATMSITAIFVVLGSAISWLASMDKPNYLRVPSHCLRF